MRQYSDDLLAQELNNGVGPETNLWGSMGNVYFARSKLSSLATRWLIECYAHGLTATGTHHLLAGDRTIRDAGLLKALSALVGDATPMGPQSSTSIRLMDQFLSSYPAPMNTIARFAEYRRVSAKEEWQPISISRQTINGYFLRFGGFLWDTIAHPYLATRAGEVVGNFCEVNEELGLCPESLCDALVERIAEKYVMRANNAIFTHLIDEASVGATLGYLIERAREFNGLSLRNSREHFAWALLVCSVKRKRGFNDRSYAARHLADQLQKTKKGKSLVTEIEVVATVP